MPSPVIVLGSINTDLVVRSRRLPGPGETVLGGEFYRAQGGKGANQAVAAARLCRQPVTLIAAVGDDALGEASRAALAQENLALDFLKTVEGQASGVALIMVDAIGENLISVASGANAHLLPGDVDAVPEKIFRHAKILLVNLEVPLETVARALRRARDAGLLTILNPAPACPNIRDQVSLDSIDVLTPNEAEAAALAGMEVASTADAIEAGTKLRREGAGSVIVTLGSAGCVVVGESVDEIPALPVEAVDATAAGDALSGALAVALAEGLALVDAARWANRAAALAVARRGAQPSLPERREVDAADEELPGESVGEK